MQYAYSIRQGGFPAAHRFNEPTGRIYIELRRHNVITERTPQGCHIRFAQCQLMYLRRSEEMYQQRLISLTQLYSHPQKETVMEVDVHYLKFPQVSRREALCRYNRMITDHNPLHDHAQEAFMPNSSHPRFQKILIKNTSQNTKKNIIAHELPSTPWKLKLQMIMVQIKGNNYSKSKETITHH